MCERSEAHKYKITVSLRTQLADNNLKKLNLISHVTQRKTFLENYDIRYSTMSTTAKNVSEYCLFLSGCAYFSSSGWATHTLCAESATQN